MTSEPKFVPEDAVEISPDGTATFRVRMIDSVGYIVEGASGVMEDGAVRMVATPWFDHEIPLTDAAELGTQKVMQEHCSIGLVVTTDGTITDIPRNAYLQAEARAIEDMQATKKPFLVIVNTREPEGTAAQEVVSYLRQTYGLEALTADCQALDADGIRKLLQQLLYAFPMKELRVYLPRWMDALEQDHPILHTLHDALLLQAQKISTLAQAEGSLAQLRSLEQVSDFTIRQIDLASGTVSCQLHFPEALFYQVLSSKTGLDIPDDARLMTLLTELSAVKLEYQRLEEALRAVKATGYGVVLPDAQEMRLQSPEILKRNGSFGVKLKANAPSIHMIRVDIDTEITPMVGDEQQSKDLIDYLGAEDPEQLWQSNLFGKSVYTLVQEGLNAKLLRTSEDVKEKFRATLSKIVNEGATSLICLIL